ncbi:MAG TPA: hypothetical protein VGH90_12880 [Chthoniobacteraceae bacterium]|jgi:hypothetical protein
MLNLTPAVFGRNSTAFARSKVARLLSGIRRSLDCIIKALAQFSGTDESKQAHLEGLTSDALARRLRRRVTPPRDR